MGNETSTRCRVAKGSCIWDTPWQRDDDAPTCTACGVNFGVITRRHHCRICGLVFCQSCSNQAVHGERACQLCFRKVMQALSEECLKLDGGSKAPKGTTAPKGTGDVSTKAGGGGKDRIRALTAEDGPTGRPVAFVGSFAKKQGARYSVRSPQPLRRSSRSHPVIQPPKAGSPFQFSCLPYLSPNTSITSEDVTLGESVLSSIGASRNITPFTFVAEEIAEVSESSAAKPLPSRPSEEELDGIYARFLEKEHSHRTTKMLLDAFLQFDLPLPPALVQQCPRLPIAVT
jgi:hypothetical protein